jgi:hypothetical protein
LQKLHTDRSLQNLNRSESQKLLNEKVIATPTKTTGAIFRIDKLLGTAQHEGV